MRVVLRLVVQGEECNMMSSAEKLRDTLLKFTTLDRIDMPPCDRYVDDDGIFEIANKLDDILRFFPTNGWETPWYNICRFIGIIDIALSDELRDTLQVVNDFCEQTIANESEAQKAADNAIDEGNKILEELGLGNFNI